MAQIPGLDAGSPSGRDDGLVDRLYDAPDPDGYYAAWLTRSLASDRGMDAACLDPLLPPHHPLVVVMFPHPIAFARSLAGFSPGESAGASFWIRPGLQRLGRGWLWYKLERLGRWDAKAYVLSLPGSPLMKRVLFFLPIFVLIPPRPTTAGWMMNRLGFGTRLRPVRRRRREATAAPVVRCRCRFPNINSTPSPCLTVRSGVVMVVLTASFLPIYITPPFMPSLPIGRLCRTGTKAIACCPPVHLFSIAPPHAAAHVAGNAVTGAADVTR